MSMYIKSIGFKYANHIHNNIRTFPMNRSVVCRPTCMCVHTNTHTREYIYTIIMHMCVQMYTYMTYVPYCIHTHTYKIDRH